MLNIREFNYNNFPKELLSVDIMNLVSKIHEFKGKEDLFIAAKPDILDFFVYTSIQRRKWQNE